MRRGPAIPRNVIVLGIVSFLTDASSEMIYPLIPVYVAALGSGALMLGIIEGIAETTASLLKLYSGIISDRIGKRKGLILLGYGISSLVRPLTGLATAAWQIVAVRMIDRVGKGIRTAPRDALIAASVEPGMRGRAYGFHRAMDHTGAVTGPILAITLLTILAAGFGMTDSLQALRWTFLFAFIPGLFAVLTIVFCVQEHSARSDGVPPFRFSLRQFDRRFLSYLAIVTLFTLGNSSDAFLLYRAQDALHASNDVYTAVASIPVLHELLSLFGEAEAGRRAADILFLPVIWSFFHIIKVLLSTPLGALSDRIGRRKVIATGWSIYALVYCSFAVLDRLPAGLQLGVTFALFAVYALYAAFTEGAEKALVADLVGPGQRGSAFGMFNFAIGIGSLPASILFGICYEQFGATLAFGSGGLIAVISIILLLIFRQEPHQTLPAGNR